jgi:subtilisin family serine protease
MRASPGRPGIRGLFVNRPFLPILGAASFVLVAAVAAYLPVSNAAAPAPLARIASQQQADLAAETDRFIVRFKDGKDARLTASARQDALDAAGRKLGLQASHGRKMHNGADVIRTSKRLTQAGANAFMRELKKDPRVASVEIDRVHRPMFSANDPLLGLQPYLFKAPGGVGLDYAWNRGTGDGVVVAVLDTGITSHPDLDANVLPGGYDFVTRSDYNNDNDGRDADPTDPGDMYCDYVTTARWHGTAVAGAIAAVGNNGIGIIGAAPGAKILPVRVLRGQCGGYTSDIADAIVWAAGGTVAGVPANAHPAEVINLSFGSSGGCSPAMQSAVDSAVAAGAVLVAAGGEGNVDSTGIMPASCNGVIGVSAARGQIIQGGMPFGAAIDVLGPGGYLPLTNDTSALAPIQTTSNAGTTTPGTPSYTTAVGSSMATAIASGTVAIMQGLRPQSPNVVGSVLRQTAMDEHRLNCDSNVCSAMFDADAATHAVTSPTLVLDEWRWVSEGNAGTTPVNVTLTLTEPVADPVGFTLATVANTATAADFVALPPTDYTIQPGETSKTITLYVKGDTVSESHLEFFNVVVSNVTGASVLARESKVTIGNDDTTFLVAGSWYYAEQTVVENFEFDVPPGATNVKVTTAFGEYGDADLFVRKDAAPTFSEYDCASTNVGFDEVCELGAVSGHFHAWVGSPSYYGYNYIRVDWTMPGTQVSVTDASVVEGQSGSRFMTFKVMRTPVSDATVTFDWDLAGGTATHSTDFTNSFGRDLTILPNREWAVITISVKGDTTLEPNETVNITLSDVKGATLVDGEGVGTILNDEGPTLAVGDVTIGEGQSGTKTATVQVSLTEPSASPVTFDLATVAGTATAGSDFVAASATGLSIPAGASSTTFSFNVNGDTTPEAHETVFVQLSNGSVSAIDDRGTVTINNDDGPALSIGDVTLVEGTGPTRVATFLVQLAAASDVPVSFTARTSAGTATPGTDYIEQVATGTIPAGMLAQTVQVAVVGDHWVEGNETFNVTLSDPVNAVLLDSTAIGTITNDDRARLSIGDIRFNESSVVKSGVFTVSLNQALSVPVSFNIATTGQGTATAGDDYVPRSINGMTIPAGQLSTTFPVTINGDTTFEGDENFVVAVSNVVNADLYDGSAFAMIVNDDNVPTLAIGDRVLVEGNSGTQQAAFVVTLSHAALSPVTFTASTTGAGNATWGDDYEPLAPTTYTIPAGQLSKNVLVTVNGDTEIETTETYIVSASNVLGAALTDGSALGTITNDDKPTISIYDDEAYEGENLRFYVELSQWAPYPIGVDVRSTGAGSAKVGIDYTALSSTLIFAPGETGKFVELATIDDAATENTENLVVALKNLSGAVLGDGAALGVIRDTDSPELSISDATVVEGHAGTKSMVFTVTLSAPAPYPVTYQVDPVWNSSYNSATQGIDYQYWTPTLQAIPAGQLSRTFTVAVIGDTEIEQQEWLQVYLNNVTGAYATPEGAYGLGYIDNDDWPKLTVSNVQTYEGDDGPYSGWLLFTVELSEYVNFPVTFDVRTNAQGTATPGVDYEAVTPTTLTIDSFMGTSVQVWVGVHGDQDVEANETFVLELSNPTNAVIADGAGLGIILNDD